MGGVVVLPFTWLRLLVIRWKFLLMCVYAWVTWLVL